MANEIERACPACGSIYLAKVMRLRHGRNLFCSRACSYKWRTDQKKTAVTAFCSNCRAEFTRQPSHFKSKHGGHFCSRACHYAGRSTGLVRRVVDKPYQYTAEGARILSEAGALTYASGKTLPYPKTELAVAELLEGKAIPFVHQQVFMTADGGISVDFYFPEKALVVELDSRDHLRKQGHLDPKRDAFLGGLGLRVARIFDTGDVDQVTEAVLGALA